MMCFFKFSYETSFLNYIKTFFMKNSWFMALFCLSSFCTARAQQTETAATPPKVTFFATMGLGSPYGIAGIGASLPVKEAFTGHAGIGLSLLGAVRVSAGVDKYIGASRKWKIGVSLAHSSKPSSIVVINNSNVAFVDGLGNEIVAARGRAIRYGGTITGHSGTTHHYWTSNEDFTKQAFYDFKSVSTLHFRLGFQAYGTDCTVGYGLNLSNPYQLASGDGTLATPWLNSVTPGGLEISIAYPMENFLKSFLTKRFGR
jgi:hypothetical protein